MSEIQHGQVEKIDNQQDFTLPKESSNPKHDESKSQQIMKDEMRSNIGCAGYETLISMPKISNVICLHDQYNDPVNIRHNSIEREWCCVVIILTPNLSTSMMM